MTIQNDAGYGLAHPIYLDVQMMLSFLAHLEGGVSVSESERTTATGARERFLKARGGIRAKLFAIGDANFEGEGSQQNRDETQVESQTERHHTEASLFNLLYDYLTEDGKTIRLDDPGQLTEVQNGQLVEFSGEFLGNPIENVLAFFDAFLPYIEEDEPAKVEPAPTVQTRAQKSRSGNPAVKASTQHQVQQPVVEENPSEEGIRVLRRMSQDIKSAPVHDLLFRTEHELEAVVTVASLYYSATTTEHLRAGEFRVIGKVTRVLEEGQSINLMRRTVLGVAGPALANDVLNSVTNSDDFNLDVPDAIVSGPAIQVLPMAIFI
ncbi:hypothetical protein GC088_13410 [Arthrobacter sp. JZ12]|uniref:DUF6414 family protein n=1 Tax=Arthrobacter sp. JZ12 TaxID=2654190 RepID=UPI002B4A1BE1|nr:hypothetical protein [Arthrobacter sp. JZ12]WRH25970.1 hypothetical protein GC088_13410 [Arthrobacter sp. JZ12]